MRSYESPAAKKFKEQNEQAKAGGVSAGPATSTPARADRPMRTIGTQTDIQLGTQVLILHEGFSGKRSANDDRDVHAWDIVESSVEDVNDEDDIEACSEDGCNEFEECSSESDEEPITRVTDQSEDENVLEVDVMEVDESDDD